MRRLAFLVLFWQCKKNMPRGIPRIETRDTAHNHAGYRAQQRSAHSAFRNAKYTPLDHPKPSCTGYSPPPASNPRFSTLYFSTIFVTFPYTRSLFAIQRCRISPAVLFSPYRFKPA